MSLPTGLQYEGTSGSLTVMAFRKLMHNRTSLFSLIFLGMVTGVAFLGYLITPDPTPYCNRQILEIAAKSPGFKVLMLRMPKQDSIKTKGFITRMFSGQASPYILLPVQDYAIRGDILLVEEFTGNEEEKGREIPVPLKDLMGFQQGDYLSYYHFPLGTDRFGRDLLSRMIIGTRVSLSVGFISVFISLLLGIFIGSMGGFFRGWADRVVMWFINVIWSIPTLLLVIAITFALGKGFWQVFIAVGLTMWVDVARVTRGQILSHREKEYVDAAKALGYKNSRIILRHILPNILGPVIVISAANFASAILIEAGLSFLGLGVQPPMPSWGSMIRENYPYLILDAAHLAIIPGLAIMFTVLAVMTIGNGLRDAFDVREKESIRQ